MKIPITKGARQYGYLIWNSKLDADIEKLLSGFSTVNVKFNGFILGEKNIDRKYHRISLGYKLTRALPPAHDTFSVSYINGVLEVKSFNGKK
jgi:hypothetical protein